MKPLPKVVIYTDGATRSYNRGRKGESGLGEGGWAALLLFEVVGKEPHRLEIQGHCEKVTNNHMELQAIVEALQSLKRPCEVTLYTDSTCAISWTRKFPPRSNIYANKLHERYKRVVGDGKHLVRFVHVKGHAGNLNNERVDEIAYAVARGLPMPIRST